MGFEKQFIYIHIIMHTLGAFIVASILLTISPGPDLFMVVTQSLEKGFRSAFNFILGLITGLCLHTLLLSAGWAQFVGERPNLVELLKIIGCIYFLYLGFRSIWAYLLIRNNSIVSYTTNENPYRQGLFMNLMNPKISLFFWLFFPAFLFDPSLSMALQYFILGILFGLQALIIFTGVAFFSIRLIGLQQQSNFKLFTGLVWVVLGLYIVLV